MNLTLLRVVKLLDELGAGKTHIPENLIQEFGDACKNLLRQDVSPRKFTFRASNAGKPSCQLWHEKNGTPPEAQDMYFPVKMIFGGLVENLVVLLLKAAGVNVQSEQVKIRQENGTEGTYDIEIDGKIWDIKSASDWSFKNKFKNGTFESILADDVFGYATQGIIYAHTIGKKFGGWIVCNKSTGELHILEAIYSDELEAKILADADAKKNYLSNNEPFKRLFNDVPEFHYNKPTGNRILCSTCGFCKFKSSKECWPDLQILPKIPSRAAERPLTYYTHVQ